MDIEGILWITSEMAQTEDVLRITVICVGSAAIFLNVIFLVSLSWVKESGTAFNRFMKSLSVSDALGSLMFIIIMYCPPGFFGVTQKENFGFLRALPYVSRSVPWMFFTAYLLTLSCLTWSQYIAVYKPWSYKKMLTQKVVSATIAYIWLVSSLQVILPMLVVTALSVYSRRQLDPMPLLHKIARVEIHVWMCVFMTSILYNICTNITVYLKLKTLLKKHRSRCYSDNAAIRKKQHSFITVSLLLLASIFCRLPLPLASMIGISVIEDEYSVILHASLALLLFLNFLVDPIVYFIRIKEVRKGLKTLSTVYLRPFHV